MEKPIICPDCHGHSLLLGPGNYQRKTNGDYIRPMAYQCKNKSCSRIFEQ